VAGSCAVGQEHELIHSSIFLPKASDDDEDILCT
jgi:hypothetical protein